eukprot:Lankesteria_metandrocarpae@DN4476_c0_g1_i2.p1
MANLGKGSVSHCMWVGSVFTVYDGHYDYESLIIRQFIVLGHGKDNEAADCTRGSLKPHPHTDRFVENLYRFQMVRMRQVFAYNGGHVPDTQSLRLLRIHLYHNSRSITQGVVMTNRHTFASLTFQMGLETFGCKLVQTTICNTEGNSVL